MKLYNYKLPCHVDGLNKHVQYLLCDNKLELHGWLTSSNMRFLKWPTKLASYVWRKCGGFFLMLGLDLQITDYFFLDTYLLEEKKKKKVKPLEEAVGTVEKRGALSDFLVYRNVQSIK